MKLTTQVWLRCESKGKPQHTIIEQLTVRESVIKIAQWLSEVYMGNRIMITLARSREELEQRVSDDLMADLESILDGALDELEESNGHSS